MQTRNLHHLNFDFWEEQANKVLSRFSYEHPYEIDLYEICFNYGVRLKALEENSKMEAYSIAYEKGRTGVIYLKESLSSVKKSSSLLKNFVTFTLIAARN